MNHATRFSILGFSVIAVSLLVGCASSGNDINRPSDSDPRPSATSSPAVDEPTAQPSGEPTASGGNSIPLDVACDVLVDAATIYELNPNLANDPSYRPSALAGRAIDSDGVSCGWINQTSGDVVAVSVASFDEVGLAATRGAMISRGGSSAPSDLGGEGVFRTEGSVGVLEIVTAPYWIVIESPMFGSASEADFIVEAVTRGLP
jgi:hypothetical protein